jgi:two-component system nitrogen regulation sensor histidine kinase GlnL
MNIPAADEILENLDESICLFNTDGRLIFLNKTAEEFFGKDMKELLGCELCDLLPDGPDLSIFLQKTLTEGRPYQSKGLEIKANNTTNADVALVPYYTAGKLDGALLCIRENLELMEREDQQFDALLYLLGTIAHEVKNPLSGIKGAAQILLSTISDSSSQEAASLIIKETDRLNTVVRNYLDIARKPSMHPVNVHEIIEHALQVLDHSLQFHTILVQKSYDPSLPLIMGDEHKLLQVLINLLKNAIEALAAVATKRNITVSTRLSHQYAIMSACSLCQPHAERKKQRWLVIAIQDSGPGIPKDTLNRIFLPFFTDKKNGSGLGLALSKKIIRDHGGVIKAKSSLGNGTTFSVYLPIQLSRSNNKFKHIIHE